MGTPIRIDPKGNITFEINVWSSLKVAVILVAAIGAGFLPIPGLDQTPAARISLMIFIGAAGLWLTEAIPPFATAIMVIVLHIYLVGQPGGAMGLDKTGLETSYRIFLNPIASPVLVLFFGGFIMAVAATKHGLDIRLARAFVKPFGTRPAFVLLGIILTTALFSMFISNTATTAMMVAILAPVFAYFEDRSAFRKALVLSVPFAANIGGMGTIIGTPPNAVAAMILGNMGYSVSFLRWMVVAVPLVIVLLLMMWVVFLLLFRPSEKRFEILFPQPLEVSWDLVVVTCTFTATVLLWMTEPLHGIPAAVVALLPVMIFTMLGIIGREDLKKIEWHVLILLAGGLTLGVAMQRTGLSQILVNLLPLGKLSPVALLCIIVPASMLISNFTSHTAAANLIIPIVVTIGVLPPQFSAVGVAFATSLAMSLPISTPPNAIAFATGSVTTKEMAIVGTIISLIGMTIVLNMLIGMQKLSFTF